MEPEPPKHNHVSSDPHNPVDAEADDLNRRAMQHFASHQLPDALPLIRRIVELLAATTATTGQPHPRLPTAIRNYFSALAASGHTPDQIHEILHAILSPAGLSL